MKRVHALVALRPKVCGSQRIGDAKAQKLLVLPIERTVVVIETRSLHHLVARSPAGEAVDGLGHDLHVVVHDPEPLGTELPSVLHAS